LSASHKVALALLVSISGFGVIAGLQLTMDHLKTGEVCPVLGPIPACYIVLFGYLCVFLTAIFYRKAKVNVLFYIGWMPVLVLAFSGVVMELTRGEICPAGPAEIPQCFFSLAMAIAAWILFRITRRSVA